LPAPVPVTCGYRALAVRGCRPASRALISVGFPARRRYRLAPGAITIHVGVGAIALRGWKTLPGSALAAPSSIGNSPLDASAGLSRSLPPMSLAEPKVLVHERLVPGGATLT